MARQEFFDVGNLEAAASYTALIRKRGDVFVGAAPRTRKSGSKDAVTRCWALWADCDAPESVERLAEFQPRPTLIVASGTPGRRQAWWALESPAPAMYAGQANRRLAHHLGADPRCAEVARIMRVPGTLNFKTDPPNPVTVVESNPGTVPILMVADLSDPRSVRSGSGPRQRTYEGSGVESIPAAVYVERLTGREVDGRGMVRCPFHKGGQERTPSFKCYPDTGGWHCFGCAEGGDVFSFGARLWGMGTTGAEFVKLRERLEGELL